MRRLIITAVLSAGLSACSYQTAGSPQGGLTLSADFTDIQNLAVGHSVQINNVRVGTITGIKLVGSGATYRVRVTMSLKKGIKVPAATTAQLSITSLLGENYVALGVPQAGLNSGPFLPDHGQIGSTTVAPAFEQVVGRAGPLLQALSGNDISTIVDAGATAFNGKGPTLQKMIKQLDDLLALFTSQRDHLDTTVTDLARLGRELAKGQDELGKLPAGLAKTTKMLADDKDRLLDTISKITDLARSTDDTVLIGHIDEIKTLVDELGPVIATLAADKTNLAGLITTMQDFVAKVPRAVFNGQLLLYPVLKPTVGNTGNYPTPSSAAGIMRSLNQMMGGVTPP